MTHKMKTMKKIFLTALALGINFSPAGADPRPAGGIRTDFGDVYIDNVGLGNTYNIRDLAGTPLKVTNEGIATVNLVMDVQIPQLEMITEIRREAGFKPVPSIDWVTLSQTQFIVPAGESAYSDIIIKIPNDPSLYGKKFQASIYSRTVGAGMVNVGVWSHLFLNLVKSPEDQAKIEQNKKRGFFGSMDYGLLPDKLVINEAPLGKTYDIKKETKKTIMIANSGENAIELRLTVVPVGSTPLTLQAGYESPADISWLGVKSKIITVDPSTFADPGLRLTLPNDPALSKKKLMFVLKVEPANPDIVGVTYYGKIYVDVK